MIISAETAMRVPSFRRLYSLAPCLLLFTGEVVFAAGLDHLEAAV
jgi:hypothetical protein